MGVKTLLKELFKYLNKISFKVINLLICIRLFK